MSAATTSEHHGHHEALDFRKWPPDEYMGRASLGKVGMWIFLLSDALMFSGFLLAYGIIRGGADVWQHSAADWQALGLNFPSEPEYGINFTAILTFILICSSVTMVFAFAAAVEGNRKKLCLFLALTALGGMLFLCGQYHEYFGIWHPGLTKRHLVFGRSAYASCFYIITSFHGAHVFTGVVLLWLTFFHAARGRFDGGKYNYVEIIGLFWHFVDLVWILVFTLVYLIPPSTPEAVAKAAQIAAGSGH